MEDARRLTADLADGRVLDITVAGPPEGLTVLFQNGTPSASVLFPPLIQAASERGLRTAAYSRPGYSASTPAPGRSVGDATADIVAEPEGRVTGCMRDSGDGIGEVATLDVVAPGDATSWPARA